MNKEHAAKAQRVLAAGAKLRMERGWEGPEGPCSGVHGARPATVQGHREPVGAPSRRDPTQGSPQAGVTVGNLEQVAT